MILQTLKGYRKKSQSNKAPELNKSEDEDILAPEDTILYFTHSKREIIGAIDVEVSDS